MVRVNECRCQLRTYCQYFVAKQVNRLARIVNALCQYLGSTRQYFDSRCAAVFVSSLKAATLMGLVNLIHAVGDYAQRNGIAYHHFGRHTHKEVGFLSNPLLAGRGLDTFCHIEVIAKIPTLAVIGSRIDCENILLLRIHESTHLSTRSAKSGNHNCTIIDVCIISLSQTESNACRTTQVGIIGIAQLRACLQIGRTVATRRITEVIDNHGHATDDILTTFWLEYSTHHVALEDVTIHRLDVVERVIIFQRDADVL